MSNNVKYLIHYQPEEVERAVKQAMLQRVVPQIRDVLCVAAEQIGQEFGGKSPFARDFVLEMLIHELVNLLALDDLETDEHIRPGQLDDAHLRYWFGVPPDETH